MTQTDIVPPALERVLSRFRAMGREEKMASLVAYAKKLEPLPERLASLDRAAFTVPECQTRVDLFPERNADGTLHFFADVNARQSPTIAAVLAITFAAVNDQPPAVTLALPSCMPLSASTSRRRGNADSSASRTLACGEVNTAVVW